MATGTIKKVIADRGFGFITADDGKDSFFHREGLAASLDFDRIVGGSASSATSRQTPAGRVRSTFGPAGRDLRASAAAAAHPGRR